MDWEDYMAAFSHLSLLILIVQSVNFYKVGQQITDATALGARISSSRTAPPTSRYVRLPSYQENLWNPNFIHPVYICFLLHHFHHFHYSMLIKGSEWIT